MQNGLQSSIKLVKSQRQDSVTLYQLEIQHSKKKYNIRMRYSKLLVVAAILPKTSVKFPPAHHLRSLFSSFTGDQSFLSERYRRMRDFFDSVSQHPDIAESNGFMSLLAQSQEIKELGDQENQCEPPAPQPKGKKLQKKVLDENFLVMI